MKTITLKGQEYEVISPTVATATKVIVDMWELLGRPEDPFSDSGIKLMNLIISVWEDLSPQERIDWYAARGQYQGAEKTIQEQVRQKTGRSLASYPFLVYSLMKVVFKQFDPIQRDNCIKMVKKWPMFRMANKI